MMLERQAYEVAIAFIFTGLTNFSSIPGILLIRQKNLMEEYAICIMTLVASLMYHTCESFQLEKIWLTEDEWHLVDNVGGIITVNQYLLFITPASQKNKKTFLYLIIIVAMISQQIDPWNPKYAVVPVFGYFILTLIYNTFYVKEYIFWNYNMLMKGILLIVPAFYCFFKGLDRKNDYLRVHHGLWHLFAGFAFFFLFQIRDPNPFKFKDIFNGHILKYTKND